MLKHAFNPGPQDTEMVGGTRLRSAWTKAQGTPLIRRGVLPIPLYLIKNKGEKSLMLDDLEENG